MGCTVTALSDAIDALLRADEALAAAGARLDAALKHGVVTAAVYQLHNHWCALGLAMRAAERRVLAAARAERTGGAA
jgi:hypothetical protein